MLLHDTTLDLCVRWLTTEAVHSVVLSFRLVGHIYSVPEADRLLTLILPFGCRRRRYKSPRFFFSLLVDSHIT